MVILLLCGSSAFALSVSTDDFNVARANRTLNQLSLQLSNQNVTIRDLKHIIGVLTRLHGQAQICVNNAQDKINTVNQLWKESKVDIKEPGELTEAQKYLQSKKNQLVDRRSACRLFVLRSGEAINSFSKTAKQLTTKKILEVKSDFFEQIVTSGSSAKLVVTKFNRKLFLANSGLKSLNAFNLTILGVLLLLVISIGIGIKYFARKAMQIKVAESFADRLRLIMLYLSEKYSMWLLISLLLAIFFTFLDNVPEKITYLSWISYALVVYVVALAAVGFLFYPFRARSSITGITEDIARPLVTRLKFLLGLLLLSFIVYVVWKDQALPAAIYALARTIFITLLAINLISILWLVNRIPKLFIKHYVLQFFINLIFTCGLIAILVAEWLGYQVLVTYVLRGIVLSLIGGFIAWVLNKMVTATLQILLKDEEGWHKNFRKVFGIKKHKALFEFTFLGFILYVLIWGWYIIFLLKIWVLSDASFRALMIALTNGFKVGGIVLIPSRILSAFAFYIIVFLIIRLVRAMLNRRAQQKVDKSSQMALAAIITYIGIAITILIGLIIAGVNFAGLAIIAGALSVGIGFGLQNVVSNFVAGIALLLEKQIKPGDRIVIGDVEGFVEKIRIISTQIKTLQYSDLIVPNSEIISKQVNNLMFRDFYYRVGITVGVKYGSDVELVKKLMLQAAQEHPEVVQGEGLYQPAVLFREFGSSALMFKLVCIIRNVNLHFVVESELNAKINQLFAENDITIAFPQQDIHVKEWPGAVPPAQEK
jgi:small-conductance mechanosensitive channel